MNISYNWLKDYVNFDLSPEELSAALTSIGLETGGIEEVQTIKGGLNGLVIGKVLTCEDHPNSDHLHITTVDLGESEPVQIVCGAANVAAGQYVVVATLGTVLYSGEESFTIKKSKIRGVESFGMICAEDEIGIGTSHDGIIVLPGEVKPGTLAKDYYNIKSDYVLEVDITPNRIDAASHYGVARDLAAYLTQRGKDAGLHRPSVNDFAIDRKEGGIDVDVANHEACIRYSGVTMRNVKVAESPDWLKQRLSAIGLRPINNVVDITNLNRQQYFMEHIGMYKTDALKSLLLKINPYLDIRTDCVKVTDDNLQELFADATIVCEAFDNPEAKAMLVNGILEHFPEKKLVSATGMAGYGSSNTIITKRIMKNFYLCGDGVTAPTYGHGLMAPRVAICAAHEANMITRLILGEEEI